MAELCGVSHHTVEAAKPQVGNLPTSKVTGTDGKQYPAAKPRQEPTRSETPKQEVREPARAPVAERKIGPPCAGMMLAQVAVRKLEEIAENDEERNEAFAYVKGWIEDHESKA